MLINDVNKVKVGNIVFGGKKRFVLIAGPCVMESQELMDEVAGGIKEICDRLGIEYIFKASFDTSSNFSTLSVDLNSIIKALLFLFFGSIKKSYLPKPLSILDFVIYSPSKYSPIPIINPW